MKVAYKADSKARYEFYFIWLIGIGYTSGTAPVGFKNYAVMRVNTLYLPFLKIQQIQTFTKVV